MAGVEEPPRMPNSTQDLIDRLRSSDTSTKEQDALMNLCRCMVKTFKNDPQFNYTAEAAALAPILQHETSQELLMELITVLGNRINKGTADRNILDEGVLKAFAHVLWYTGAISHIKSNLGSVLHNLSTRLGNAKIAAELQTQYTIVCSISAILDSMVDIKVSGLSRKDLHEPLLKQLKELSSDQDMRLAFAATYAYQALLCIKDDEGPYQALLRYTTAGIRIGAKLAGAVSKMDPGAALDALPSVNSVLSAVQTLYDLGKDVADVLVKAHETKDWKGNLSKLSKQKDWYRALRYTDLLLRAKAWSSFREFIKQVSCRAERNFLCGLLSQIEALWLSDEITTNRQSLEELFAELVEDGAIQDPTLQAWIVLTGTTMGRLPTSSSLRRSRNPFKKAPVLSSDLNSFATLRVSTPDANELLTRAWSTTEAEASKIFYADASINYRYKSGKALHIERLSSTDKLLPLEQCYINLGIINQSESGTEKSEPSGFSLQARLKLEAANNTSTIALETLFNERKLLNGLKSSPRRIFIRGRAGIGKSTMCKKIVDNFMKGTASDKFDRLIWLSLRKLINKPEGYTLDKLFEDEFLDENISDKAEIRSGFAKVMERHLAYDKLFQERTLFLLDGLDEVSSRWSQHVSMHRFLENLLQMPNVILTSRPQAKNLDIGAFDLELETIGFLPEQVSAYIRYCVTDEDLVISMEKFLEQKPLIADLMRIPIQLDAFCHVWQSKGRSNLQNISTMTLLYLAVCEELGKKDVQRLEKEFQVHSLAGFELAHLLDNEQKFLDEFAFQGLSSNVIEFDYDQQNMIAECVSRRGVRLQRGFRTILESMSYLRISDSALGPTAQSYHFLHLTFQEFFAAKHWVEHWEHNKPLQILPLGRGARKNQMTPSEFLKMEKYNPRYNIFWRFVTGLVQTTVETKSTCEELSEFIKLLDDAPCDQLGYVHHRLLMYALSEIKESDDPIVKKLRTTLEVRLGSWAVFEAKTFIWRYRGDGRRSEYEGLLIRQEEFPVSITDMLLQSTDHKVVKLIVKCLRCRTYIPESTIGWVAAWILKSNIAPKRQALEILCRQTTVTLGRITPLVNILTQHRTGEALAWIGHYFQKLTISNDLIFRLLSDLIDSLEDKTRPCEVPQFFENATILCARPYLTKEVLVAWVKIVSWADKTGRSPSRSKSNPFDYPQSYTMIDCLCEIPMLERLGVVRRLLRQNLSQNLIDTLGLLVKDLDTRTRQDIVTSVVRSIEPEERYRLPLLLINDSGLDIRRVAVEVFFGSHPINASRSHFASDIEGVIVRRFLNLDAQDIDAVVRQNLVNSLLKPDSRPLLKWGLGALDSSDPDIRRIAIWIFQQDARNSLWHRYDAEVEEALITRFLDADPQKRREIVSLLMRRNGESRQMRITSILAMRLVLESFSRESSPDLIRLLCSQPELPLEMAVSICMFLDSKDQLVVESSLAAMDNSVQLHPLIVSRIAGLVQYPISRLRDKALEILTLQKNLSEQMLDFLTEATSGRSKSWCSRLTQKWSNRTGIKSAEIITMLSTMLRDVTETVRLEAILVLRDMHELNKVCRRWMLDKQKDFRLRHDAIQCLGQDYGPRNLGLELEDWVTVMGDQDSKIVEVARTAIYDRFKHDKYFYLLYLKYLLNECTDIGDLVVELRIGIGLLGRLETMRPKYDTEIAQRTPLESVTLVANGLQAIVEHYRRAFDVSSNESARLDNTSGELIKTTGTSIDKTSLMQDLKAIQSATMILGWVQELPLQVWETLVKLWKYRIPVDVIPLRDEISSIICKHSWEGPLLPGVCDLITSFLCQYDTKAGFPNRTDGVANGRTIANISLACVNQLRNKAINADAIVHILNAQGTSKVVQCLAGFLVKWELELDLVHQLNNESLTVICLEWIHQARITETSCYRRGEGLYLQRNGIETKLKFQSSGIDGFLGILRDVMKGFGFEDTPVPISQARH